MLQKPNLTIINPLRATLGLTLIIISTLISCDNNSNITTFSADTEKPTPTVILIETSPTKNPPLPPNPTPTPEVEALFLYNRGLNLLRAEQFTESVNVFSTLIKRMPDLAIAYKSRGAAYYHLERFELAKKDLEKALTLDIDLGGTHLYLGLIYRDEGNLKDALRELQLAVNLIHPVRETEELQIAESALQNLTR
tara:strand:+ start:205 stop:789 length:585 start_codon:yes stop_codon:yes gene_type:complete